MKKQDKEKIYLRSMVLVLGLTCFGLVANYTGMQGLSGQGVGGGDQVGCGGDMSGYAVGTENTADEAIAETNEIAVDEGPRAEVKFYYNDAEWVEEFLADEYRLDRAQEAEGPCASAFVQAATENPDGDGSVVVDALRCIFVRTTLEAQDEALAQWAQVAHDNPDSYFDEGVPTGIALQDILEDIFAQDIGQSENMGVEHPGLKSRPAMDEKGITNWGQWCGQYNGGNIGGGQVARSGGGHPISGLDEACKKHDYCLAFSQKPGCGCDKALASAAALQWNQTNGETNGRMKCAEQKRVCTKRRWGRCRRHETRWVPGPRNCRPYSGAMHFLMNRCPNPR